MSDAQDQQQTSDELSDDVVDVDGAFARLVQRFQDRLPDEVCLDVLLQCAGNEAAASARLASLAAARAPAPAPAAAHGRSGQVHRHGAATPAANKKRLLGMLGLGAPCRSPADTAVTADGTGAKRQRIADDSGQPSQPADTPGTDAFQTLLSAARSQTAAPSDPQRRPPMTLTASTVASHIPCELLLDVLTDQDADTLLRDMLAEAASWHRLRVVMFDKTLESYHNTFLYVDSRHGGSLPDLYYSGRKTRTRDWLPSMAAAAAVVAERVNERYDLRERSPLEVQGKWVPTIAVANSYNDGSEAVGGHTDKLTYIGPRPVIASLTLGATRTFRVRRNGHANANGTGAGSGGGQTYDLLLPHNSLLIMFPPLQEEYKHEVPRVGASLRRSTGVLIPHATSGERRINLTFRMVRDELARRIPVCGCGAPCELRPVIKAAGSLGWYFWSCGGGRGGRERGGPSGDSEPSEPSEPSQPSEPVRCEHFEWFDAGCLEP
ncbi:hypothetical protein BC831DRAFT_403579 [Entophlyctis helioformis]|nr:hypothetical protein BC831DRAFT_403579 [Entophlyctis helioformis]